MRSPIWIFGLLSFACDQRADVGDLPGRDAGTGADTGVSADPITQFCTDFFTIKCAASPTCCSNPAWVYDSQAECIAKEALDCIQDLGEAPVYRLGKATVGAAPAMAVLADAQRAADVCLNEGGIGPPLVGTVPRGGDCTFTLSDGFFLACQPGLACIADSVEGASGHELYRAHCDAPRDLGATCIEGAPGQCGRGHYCDGTCKVALERNASCTDSRACDGRLTCSPTTQRCELPSLSADDAYCFPAVEVSRPKPSCSTTSNIGSGGNCSGEWVCAGTFAVECDSTNGVDQSCRCLENAVEVGRFTATGVCISGGTLGDAARDRCGFPL